LDEAYVFKAALSLITKEYLGAKECVKKAIALNPKNSADAYSIYG
jgi:hypothetical protein